MPKNKSQQPEVHSNLKKSPKTLLRAANLSAQIKTQNFEIKSHNFGQPVPCVKRSLKRLVHVV